LEIISTLDTIRRHSENVKKELRFIRLNTTEDKGMLICESYVKKDTNNEDYIEKYLSLSLNDNPSHWYVLSPRKEFFEFPEFVYTFKYEMDGIINDKIITLGNLILFDYIFEKLVSFILKEYEREVTELTLSGVLYIDEKRTVIAKDRITNEFWKDISEIDTEYAKNAAKLILSYI